MGLRISKRKEKRQTNNPSFLVFVSRCSIDFKNDSAKLVWTFFITGAINVEPYSEGAKLETEHGLL